MGHWGKRFAALCLALCCIASVGAGEGMGFDIRPAATYPPETTAAPEPQQTEAPADEPSATAEPTQEPAATAEPAQEPAATTTPLPVSDGDETIIEDYDAGYWFYESKSQGLRVEIRRFISEEEEVLWYEADIQTCAETPLEFFSANEENPGHGFRYPERIMRDNKAVFGINDDQFAHRMYNHDTVGIIIRNGKIISSKTRKSGNKSWPTLDTAAFFPDGTMQVFLSKDVTAQEYLDMGAENVLSFGPYLLKDGEMNPQFGTRMTDRENRMGLGMVEPYHYVAVYVEGRNKYSRGADMEWMAKKMLELNATDAINLDGGATACMVFMGKKIKISNPNGVVRSERSVSGMIAVGHSSLVPEYTGVEEK